MLNDEHEPSAGAVALSNLKINITNPRPKPAALALGDIETKASPAEAPKSPKPFAASHAEAPKSPLASSVPKPLAASHAEAPKSPLASSVLVVLPVDAPATNANADMRSSVFTAQKNVITDRKEASDKKKALKAEAKRKTQPKKKASHKQVVAKPSPSTTKPSPKQTKPSKNMNKQKPKSWIKKRPTGCSRCRFRPGCTPSCYTNRGEAMPR